MGGVVPAPPKREVSRTMPPTPSERLAAVQRKVERAKKHIDDLTPAVTAFSDAHRQCVRVDDDPQTGEKVYRANLVGAPPVGDIPLIIGDVVHNLRSAFDHLAWQLVEANGGIPGRRTGYPLCGSPTDFQKPETKGKVKGVRSGALKLIEATQPYQSGYDCLGKLSELDNFDKHRLLLVAAIRLTVPTGPGIQTRLTPHAAVQDGEELCRVAPGYQNDNLNFTYTISVREPQIVESEPIVPYLTQLAQFCDGVISQFSPFL